MKILIPFSISCRLLLVKEVVSLMYLISVYDPFFDTHLKQCEYWYVFVLNRLSYLFSTAKEEEQMDEGWFCYEVDITLLLLFCSSKTWYLAKKLMIVDVSIFHFTPLIIIRLLQDLGTSIHELRVCQYSQQPKY